MSPTSTLETSARPLVKPLIAFLSAQKVAAVILAPSCNVKRPLITWVGGGLEVLCEATPEALEVLEDVRGRLVVAGKVVELPSKPTTNEGRLVVVGTSTAPPPEGGLEVLSEAPPEGLKVLEVLSEAPPEGLEVLEDVPGRLVVVGTVVSLPSISSPSKPTSDVEGPLVVVGKVVSLPSPTAQPSKLAASNRA